MFMIMKNAEFEVTLDKMRKIILVSLISFNFIVLVGVLFCFVFKGI